MIEDWILIYQTEEEYQAEVIKSLLEHKGLHPVIMDKKDDEFRSFGVVNVYVAPVEAEAAKQCIAENESEEE